MPRPTDSGARRWTWAAAVVAGEALLLFNMTAWHGGTPLSELRWPRRYWEDSGAGAKLYLDRRSPRVGARAPDAGDALDEKTRARSWQAVRLMMIEKADQAEIRPTQFWRTIPDRPLLRARNVLVAVRPHEDHGRALALGVGYGILGGAAPSLLLWLGILACLPVLAWASWELFDAGFPMAAVTLPLLLGASPFVIGCLSLPHSAVGFYLIALVALVGLSAYGAAGTRATLPGALARAAAAGVVFGLCALMRSDTVLLFPGFALALGLAHRRMRLRWRTTAGILALFMAPYLILNAPRPRPVWVNLWEGLGDFDTTRGHVWRDADAERALRDAGLEPGPDALFGWLDAAGEAYFRRSVLRDIREDPAWYARILQDRLFATVTQSMLWPTARATGRSMAVAGDPHHGDMDKYYRLTPTADTLGIAGRRVELPIFLMVAPTLALVVLAAAARGSGRRAVAILACPALAALGTPVLLSTASALETQAFALVYALGFGLLLDGVRRLARPRLHESAGGVTSVVTSTMTTIAE